MNKVDFRKTPFTRIPKFLFEGDFIKELSSTNFVVYAYLCSKVDNESKECIISTQYIADELSLTRRTIASSISKLNAVGLIDIKNRYRGDGGRLASKYTLKDYPR